jgi:putative selenate reductase
MSDKMHSIGIKQLLKQITEEYIKENSIFGITGTNFYKEKQDLKFSIFDNTISSPVGPAAGPHTQLAQNIVSAYLTGGRFFELKTVQILDELTVEKPCIDSYDECYNVEWSQELKLHESYEEYLKAWFILHFLHVLLNPGNSSDRNFIFNMSVGYNLDGIKQERMQTFINSLIDASINPLFSEYKKLFLEEINSGILKNLIEKKCNGSENISAKLNDIFENISPNISNSVTLSTMHGCPPAEIESIAKYLISEKNLNTYVKLNPTLLGYNMVHNTFNSLGYKNIFLNEHSFESDLKFEDALPMISRLQEFAKKHNKQFGVKLSNTLAVRNKRQVMPGEEMYMSGRALFPLTINVAAKLAEAFKGELNISFSGGASIYNSADILKCGIFPITYATDLLKPGGYKRLFHIAEKLDKNFSGSFSKTTINVDYLKKLAENSLTDEYYKKEFKKVESIKVNSELPVFDCFIAPCSAACPIHQDVAEYVRLIDEQKYTEAFEVIVSKNALPNITAHICDHQCMYHCTRWDYDAPVEIRDYKKKAVLNGYEEFIKKSVSGIVSNNIPAAVIGAGPSGLAASYFLAMAGFDVTVFEKTGKAGGVVQNIIPYFRLPQSAIDKDIEFIKRLGVKFQYNTDENFSISGLKGEGYKYIYISIGAELSNGLQLDKQDKEIINALDFLSLYHQGKSPALGKNVAVVGGGNSAMDAARAAKRVAGVDNVSIIYRRTMEFMPADKEELDAAIEDGVIINELSLPVEFTSGKVKCQKMKLGDIDKDNRRKVISMENEFEYFEIDTLITAIGESVDTTILSTNNISLGKNNKAVIDFNSNETSVENVYIGGDASRGPATVVQAIADGKKAAEAIIKKENINLSFNKDFSYLFNIEQRIESINSNKAKVYNSSANAANSRCLECNILCNKCIDVCPNRANAAIKINSGTFRNINQILHLDGLCNECGNCATFCPHQGAPYKDKITIFRNKEEFEDSLNNGFYFSKTTKEDITAVIRSKSVLTQLTYSYDGKLEENGNKELPEDILKISEMIGTVISDYSYLIV